ncbi:hypothetical protein GGF32_001059 [Allomyces javanicus]|nr:hypothetical protein GGF32_001059 [Allomyces javanicus]
MVGIIEVVKAWYRPTTSRRPLFDPGSPGDDAPSPAPDAAAVPDKAAAPALARDPDAADATPETEQDAAAAKKAVTLAPRYYCNGRLTKRQFTCLHVVLAMFVFTIIIVPLMYFVVVPAIIRAKVKSMPLSSMNISAFEIKEFDSDGFKFQFAASLPEQFPIAVWSKVTPRQVQVQTDPKKWNDDSQIMAMDMPPLEFNLKSPQVAFDGNFRVPHVDNMKKLVTEFSSDEGLSARAFHTRMRVDIAVFGITFYKSFEVEKDLEVPNVKANLLQLWSVIPDWVKSPEERHRTTKLTEAQSLGSVSYTFLPQFPPVVLKSFAVNNTDKGPVVTAEMSMANPTVATMTLPPTMFDFNLEGEILARLKIEGVSLKRGQSDMTLRAVMEIDPQAKSRAPRALSRMAAKILGGGVISVEGSDEKVDANAPILAAIQGPVVIDGASFAEKVTPPLVLRLPIQEMCNYLGVAKVKDLFTPSGVQMLLKRSQFNLTVTSTEMIMPFEISMPSFLPLPTQNLDIPFSFSVTAARGGQSIMGIGVHDVGLFLERNRLGLRSKVVITPTNTDGAAKALKEFTDAVLFDVKASTIDVKDISLTINNSTLPWSKALLDGLVVTVPVPGIDIAPVFDAFTNRGTMLPVRLRSLLLHQLDAAPGFHTKSSFDVIFPDPDAAPDAPFAIPKINMDIGFASLGVAIDDVDMAGIKLPSGAKMLSGKADDVVADATLAAGKDAVAALTPKLQGIADAFLNGQPLPSKVVLGSVKFGPSEQAAFKTFSLVRIPVALAKVQPIIMNLGKTLIDEVTSKKTPLVKVKSVDVAVDVATQVKASMAFTNPWPLDVAIGKTSLSIGLDGNMFAAVTVGAIAIKPDGNQLDLTVSVQFNNNDAAQDPLKEVVEQAWKMVLFGSEFTSTRALSIRDLVIDSPAGNAQGRIDQFSQLKVGLPLNQLVGLMPTVMPLVDLSAVLPTSITGLLDQAKPAFLGADLATKEGQTLQLTPSVGLNNPLAVSMSLKWASVDILLQGAYFCTAQIGNLTLVPGKNNLEPVITLKFAGSKPEAATAVAQMITDLMAEWRIKTPIDVANALFGSAADKSVTLFRKAQLTLPLAGFDLQPYVKPILDNILASIPTLDSILSGTSSLNPKFLSLSLKTQPGASLEAGVTMDLTNPLPFSASIGYLALDASLDGVPLGHITVAPFKIGRGRTTLKTTVWINSKRGAGPKVNGFVQAFLSGAELKFRVGASAPVLGASDKDVITAFSKVNAEVPLNQILRGTHKPIDLVAEVTSRINGALDGMFAGGLGGNGTAAISIPLLPGMAMVVGGIGITAQPGKQMRVDTTLKLAAEFDIDIQIGYLAMGTFLNNVPLISASLPDGFKIKQNADIKQTVWLAFNDIDDIQNQAAELVKHLFDDNVPGTVAVGEIVVGSSRDDTIDMLSALRVELPIGPIMKPVMAKVRPMVDEATKAISSKDFVAVKDKALVISLTKSIYFAVRDISVATAPHKTLTVGIKTDVHTPLPLSINVPYIAAAVTLNSRSLGHFALNNLVLVNGQASGLELAATLTLDGSSDVANDISNVIQAVMRGDSLKGTSISVQSPVFGVSASDVIRTFAKVQVGVDAGLLDGIVGNVRGMVGDIVSRMSGVLDSVLDGQGGSNATAITVPLLPGMSVVIGGVAILAQPAKQMKVEASYKLAVEFNLDVQIGHLAMSTFLNNVPFVAVTLPDGIKIKSNVDATQAVALVFNDAGDIQNQVAELSKHLFDDNVPGTVAVGQIAVGASRDDTIDLLSKVRVEVPLNTLVKPIMGKIGPMIDEAMKQLGSKDLLAIKDNAITISLTKSIGVVVRDISVSTAPNKALAVGIKTDIKTPFPLTINVPYIAAGVTLYGRSLVTFAVSNIALNNGQASGLALTATMTLDGSSEVVNDVAKLVDGVLQGHSIKGTQVGIQSAVFGVSSSDTINTFGRARFDLDAGLFDSLIGNLRGAVLGMVGKIELKITNNGDKGMTIALSDKIKVDLASLNIASKPHGLLVDIDAALTLPFSINLNLNYVGATMYLNGAPIVSLETSVVLNGSSLKKMQVSLGFPSDIDAGATQVANLVNAVLAPQKPLLGDFAVSQATIGMSLSDKIDVFRAITVKLPVQTVLGPVMDLLPKTIDPVDMAEKLGVQLGSMDVKALPDRKMAVGTQVAFNNPFPVSVSMGYATVSIGVDSTEFVAIAVNKLQLSANGKNKLVMDLQLTFSNSVDAQEKLAQLVRDPKSIMISHIAFGNSPDDVIGIMAKTNVNVPLSMFTNGKMIDFALKQLGLKREDLAIDALIKRGALQTMDIDIGAAISVTGQISLALPVAINVDMPVAGLVAYIEGAALTGVNVRHVLVQSRGGRVTVSFDAKLDMAATEPAQVKVADLVNQFLSDNKNLTLTAGVGTVVFGASTQPKDVILTAARVRYDMDVTPAIAYFRGMLPDKLDIVDIAKSLGVQVGRIGAKAQPGAKMVVDTAVSLNNSLPFNVTLGYASLTMAVSQSDLVTIEVGQVALRKLGQNTLSLNLAASFVNSDDAQRELAAFIQKPTSIGVTGVRFGASPDESIRLLSKARINVPTSLVINKKVFGYLLDQVGLKESDLTIDALAKRLDIGKLDVHVAKDMTINLQAAIALPVNLDVSIPYAGVVAYLGDATLARVVVQDVGLTSREGKIQVACKVTMQLDQSDHTQVVVADLVNKVVANANVTLVAAVDGVQFGVSAQDAVLTASKVHVGVDATVLYDKAKGIVMDYVNHVLDWLVIERADMFVLDGARMGAKAAVDLSKLPFINRVSLKLEWASVDVFVNNFYTVTPHVTSLTLDKGKLQASAEMVFSKDPKTMLELGAVCSQIGPMLFNIKVADRPLQVGVRGVHFGSDKDNLVEILAKVNVNADAAPYIPKIQGWYDKNLPFGWDKLEATLVKEGIAVKVRITNHLPIPLYMSVPAVLGQVFYENMGHVLVNAWVTNVDVHPGMVSFDMLIDPVFPDVMEGLNDAVPRLLSFKNFAEKARIGGFVIYTVADAHAAKPEQTFDVFAGTRMAVPELKFWSPLTIRPILINPFTEGLGINLEVGWTNNGPLQLNIGNIDFGLVNSERNSQIGHVMVNNFVLKPNTKDGGKNVALAKARLTLNLLDIPSLLIDLVAHIERFGYHSDIRWDPKVELVWLNRIVERLPAPILARIWEVLFGIIRNSSIKLFKTEGHDLALKSANHTTALSRRWLGKRAADQMQAKMEISKWGEPDPIISPELSKFVIIDWSGLKVEEE